MEEINYGRLQNIKGNVELMNKSYQIEILKLFKYQENVVLNQNNNGIFINLTDLDEDILEKLEKYIKYVNIKEKQLQELENQKELIENKYF